MKESSPEDTKLLDKYGNIMNEAKADPAELVDTAIVEAIWSDLDGRIERKQVYETAVAIAQSFAGATVTTFLPLFIRRRTYEQLKLLID